MKCVIRFHFVLVGIALFGCRAASANCWNEASARYGLDPFLLQAIAWKESRGWTHAVGPQLKDGNHALGLMQINSIHLPQLKKYGILREHLFDPCVSQTVGAWILADCIQRLGEKWAAVGCYFAGAASKAFDAQARYIRDVQTYYAAYRLQASQTAPSPLPFPAVASR